MFKKKYIVLVQLIVLTSSIWAQNYPDQHYVLHTEKIWNQVETNSGLRLSDDGTSIQLEDGFTQGYIILLPDTSDYPFNRGLPSWNGTVTDENSSFVVQMRFPYGSGWSTWLTVGYWKEQNWGSFGATNYAGGEVDYDYVLLDNYQDGWQYKIYMKRQSMNDPSPTIHKISFFVSDSRTTEYIDIVSIVNDNPEAI